MTPKQRKSLLEHTANEIETDFWVDYVDEHYRFKTDKILIDYETGEVFFCKLHEDGFVMQRTPADDRTIAELDTTLIDISIKFKQKIKEILREVQNDA